MKMLIRALALWACMGASAFAQVGMGVLPWGGGAASAAPSFSLAYQSSTALNDTGHTTIDYGTLSFSSGATRTIVFIQYFPGGTSNTVMGVTIGGVALAQVSGAYIQQGGADTPTMDIWESTGALSGSSGDVQVTYNMILGSRSAVALYNLVTTTPASAGAETGSAPFSTTIANSTPLAIPSGGGGVFGIMTANGTAISSVTNGIIDASPPVGSDTNFNFGHTNVTGSTTVTGNLAGPDVMAISVAAWGP